mmetsp:Transcript_10890/g.19956  ORF Transcript_10890/g.19956 Transcript_10890/m.19956 type:complete len:495 (-) Transcript_10890:255-1739(-)|eukprot:CAMPEP_0197517484 /NCGR_PEP_ID=MMETSP1318-20131121/2507_1 /TAXON_ID=552666 /ORGANISM="Partenskyella glossopodia, Strain RCC365" /LENGTH=494 /DNA_ID=CAMNT_0043067075 /DNA_START=81 /DNA_END=1565 /DNA_ORIENTATION=+
MRILLLAVATAAVINVRKKESVNRESLPFVDVSPADAAAGKRIKHQIENLGSWWAHIGSRIYSPAAEWISRGNEDESSFIMEEMLTTAKLKSLEGYYIAVGGKKEDLPEEFAPHRVGGTAPYHILHLPKIVESKLNESSYTTTSSNGNRREFNMLIKLEDHFMPIKPYVVSASYKSPLNMAQMQAEKLAVQYIDESTFHSYLTALTEFGTRAIGASNEMTVQNYIESKLTSMGYKTCKQNVPVHEYKNAHNIIAVKPGTSPNAKFIVVGAHYDSRPFEGSAPGAEDNGSGSAALLTMAEAYAKGKFNASNHVIFVAYTGEELGLYGSTNFVSEFGEWNNCNSLSMLAKAAEKKVSFKAARNDVSTNLDLKKRLESLKAAVIMDEIGWASPKLSKHTATLESKEFSKNTLDHLAASSHDANGETLALVSSYHPFGSDHMPFLDRGKEAVLTINGDDEAYPNYHKSTDTIENVDDSLAVKIAKMNLGAVVRMAFEN